MSDPRQGSARVPCALPLTRRLRYAPDFPPGHIQEAITRHRACLAGTGPGRVLKHERPNAVTLVELSGGRLVCVKEYAWRGRAHRLKDLLRPTPARREWRAAERLARLGVRAPEPYALLEAPLRRHASSGFLILEGLCGFERLDQYVVKRFSRGRAPREAKRRFLEQMADSLRRLHDTRIHHGDTKAANLLVREDDALGWELCLVDLADVGLGRRVRYGQRTVSLAQLNASVPLAITAPDRLRFLKRYARGLASFTPLSQPWRDILRITRTRKCIWDKELRRPPL